MSRSGNAAFDALLSAGHKELVPLLYLGLDTPVRLAALPYDVVWGGYTWQAALGVMAISGVTETSESMQGLQITLSVNDEALAFALDEDVFGAPVALSLGILDGSDLLQVDASVWSGWLDRCSINDDGAASSITLYAEHRLADWDRPIGGTYTDADQQRRYPGDLGLQFVTELSDKQVAWPAASFFYKD